MEDGKAGRLEAIWIKRAKRGPMDARERVTTSAGRGLTGNANRGGWRQVTILSREAWRRAEEELGVSVDPRSRRANLLVSGLDLEGSRGRMLLIGPCRLRVLGETRPCERMDEAQPGLRRALDPEWRGGVFGEVLDDAELSVGDRVEWAAEPAD